MCVRICGEEEGGREKASIPNQGWRRGFAVVVDFPCHLREIMGGGRLSVSEYCTNDVYILQ